MTRFDTTPDPAFLRAMQNQKWNVHGALSELVDNSLGSGRGDARHVYIMHDKKQKTIAVLDDGRGMEAIGRLFQLGNTIGRSPGDIGIYGSGGTMACLWLAHKVAIWSLRDGKVSHDKVDWTAAIRDGHFPSVSDDWVIATSRNTPAPLFDLGHGTLIVLHLAPKRRFHASNVKRDLGKTYAPALRKGREITWATVGRDGVDLVTSSMLNFEGGTTIDVDITLDVHGDLLPVHGVVGYSEHFTQSESKLSIGYGTRVITTTRDCYVSPDGEEKFLGAGVGGWLDLGDGWQPYLTTTKDGVDDSAVWEALMAHIFQEIRPLLLLIDEQELKVEFDNLAINLADALDGLKKYRERVGGEENPEGEEVGTGTRRGRIPVEHPGGTRNTKRIDIDENAEKKYRKIETSGSEVRVVQESDEKMEGQLCMTAMTGDTLVVYVNKDHLAIQEALKAHPVNRMMLNMGITREIAAELTSNPEYARFLPAAVRELNGDDPMKAARVTHAVLMKGVRPLSVA